MESLGVRIKRYENKAKASLRGLRAGSTNLQQKREPADRQLQATGHKMESLPKYIIKDFWLLKKQNTEVILMVLQIDTGKYLA